MRYASNAVPGALVAAFTNSKGGTGKSTTAANVGGVLADPEVYGLRVLLIDCDQSQPALSSYYPLDYQAPGGIFELLTLGQTEGVISRTNRPNLDVIVSNDPENKLPNVLLHAPDGRFRLKAALPKLAQDYDAVLVDTKGEKGILVETALLSVDLAICPVPTETLPAREFHRGMLELVESLRLLAAHTGGYLKVPPLAAFFNLMDERTVDAQQVAVQLREEVFSQLDSQAIRLLDTVVPRRAAIKEACSFGLPVHVHNPARARGQDSPCAAEIMKALVAELFPTLPLQANGRAVA